MKTLQKISMALAISAIAFVSCKDDDDSIDSITEKIQHPWLVDSITLRVVTATSDIDTTYLGTGNDYYDFRTDGKLYSRIAGGTPDTATYRIISNNRIVIDGDTGTIETLTNSKLIGSTRYQLNATDYNVVKSYLRR